MDDHVAPFIGTGATDLLHDLRARIALAGGDEAFVDLLDRFSGWGTRIRPPSTSDTTGGEA